MTKTRSRRKVKTPYVFIPRPPDVRLADEVRFLCSLYAMGRGARGLLSRQIRPRKRISNVFRPDLTANLVSRPMGFNRPDMILPPPDIAWIEGRVALLPGRWYDPMTRRYLTDEEAQARHLTERKAQEAKHVLAKGWSGDTLAVTPENL